MFLDRSVYECTQKHLDMKKVCPFTEQEDLFILREVENWTGNLNDLWLVLEVKMGRKAETIQIRWIKILTSRKEIEKKNTAELEKPIIFMDNHNSEVYDSETSSFTEGQDKERDQDDQEVDDQDVYRDCKLYCKLTLDGLIENVEINHFRSISQSAARKRKFSAEEDQFIVQKKEEWEKEKKKGFWKFLAEILNRDPFSLIYRFRLITGKDHRTVHPKKILKNEDFEIHRVVRLTMNSLLQKVQSINGEKRKHTRFSAEEDDIIRKEVANSNQFEAIWSKIGRQMNRKRGIIMRRWESLKRKDANIENKSPDMTKQVLRKEFSIEEDEFIWRTNIEWGKKKGVCRHIAGVLDRQYMCVFKRRKLLENKVKNFPKFKISTWEEEEILQLEDSIARQGSSKDDATEFSISWKAISVILNRNPFDCKAKFENQTLKR